MLSPRFCNFCGQKLIYENQEHTSFDKAGSDPADSCDNDIDHIDVAASYSAIPPDAAYYDTSLRLSFKKIKSLPKKMLATCLAIIILLFVIIGAALMDPFNAGASIPITYVKDGQIFFANINKLQPIEATRNLNGDNINISNKLFNLITTVAYSSDGKKMFYPDNFNNDTYFFTLYYRDLTKNNTKEGVAIKLDADISGYQLSLTGNLVVYIKDSNLYLHNLKERTLVAKNVKSFYFSNDGKTLIYKLNNGYLYYLSVKGKKDPVLIDTEVTGLAGVKNNDKIIYYSKGSQLFKKIIGKDSVKLTSNAETVHSITDSGEIYYTKKTSSSLNASDYVIDDMMEKDSEITEPNTESFKKTQITGTYTYEVVDWEAYYNEYNRYSEKLLRDMLRDQLEDGIINIGSQTLYYYDGKKEVVINERVHQIEASAGSSLVFSSAAASDLSKVKLSEVSSAADVESILTSASVSLSYSLVVKESVFDINQKNARSFVFSDSSESLYFIDQYDSEASVGKLMKISIGKAVKSLIEIDSDVSFIFLYKNNRLLYFKNYDPETGNCDLYESGALLAENVAISTISAISNSNSLIFLSNVNPSTQLGSLYLLKGKKLTKISDYVAQAVAYSEKDIAYLYDYDINKSKGELMIYKGFKAMLIDSDISAIVPLPS